MPELTQKERLQPSLLDRLSDDEPSKQTESREQRILSFPRLRKSVIRDLTWLLNAGCLGTTEDLEKYPEIQRSVLNYGIPDITGIKVSNVDIMTMERLLRRAINHFEPRIISNSLHIRVIKDDNNMGPNTVTFEIEGELWAQPTPERLYLKTILDLELGNVEFR